MFGSTVVASSLVIFPNLLNSETRTVTLKCVSVRICAAVAHIHEMDVSIAIRLMANNQQGLKILLTDSLTHI